MLDSSIFHSRPELACKILHVEKRLKRLIEESNKCDLEIKSCLDEITRHFHSLKQKQIDIVINFLINEHRNLLKHATQYSDFIYLLNLRTSNYCQCIWCK